MRWIVSSLDVDRKEVGAVDWTQNPGSHPQYIRVALDSDFLTFKKKKKAPLK